MTFRVVPFSDVWQKGVFNVPTDIVDKYIRLASEYQIKALLIVLKNGGTADTKFVAKALGITNSDTEEIMSFWQEEGVLLTDSSANISTKAQNIEEKETEPPKFTATPEPQKEILDSKPSAKKIEILPPPRLTPKDIVTLCRDSKELDLLLNEAQQVLGRTISTAEQEMIVNMHNYYGLPVEVVLMLLGYYRSEKESGKSISISYINKMANTWAEEGIVSVTDADEKLMALAKSDKYWQKIVELAGIHHKSPTIKQREMINAWQNDFDEQMITIACDLMKENTERPSLKYVDGILKRWKKENIKTPSDVKKQQDSFAAGKTTKNSGKSGKLAGKPSYDINKIINDTMNNTDIKF